MTSCCVVSSISATRSGVGGGAVRTGSTTSAGTRPAFAWASRTSVSTRHHNSYLCWSLQTRPISGRVYRSIMRSPRVTAQLVAPRAHSPAPPGKLQTALLPTAWRTAMFQRVTRLVGRARERIRAAEQDPHAWPDTRVLLDMDDEVHGHLAPDTSRPGSSPSATPAPVIARVDASPGTAPAGQGPASDGPPQGDEPATVGSPAADAPDVDVPGGISGPPRPGGPPPQPGRDRSRGSLLGPDTPQAGDASVPNGLRVAAAWSWRTVVVVAALYLLLRAAAYLTVVIVPVFVALLLAALLQPGATALRRHGWPSA